MGLANTVKVIISGDAKGAKEAFKSVQEGSEKTNGALGKLAKFGVGALAGVATAAIGVGAEFVKMAIDEQNSHAKLVTALKNSGQSWAANSKAIEEADKAGEHFGYTTDQTEAALANAETATGSTTKSLKLLSLAQNLAALKGIPLADALSAVTKASEGQLKPLKALQIDLPVAAGGAESVKKAMLSLGTAQLGVKMVEEKIHDGRLKGKAASDALRTATNTLSIAQSNYKDSATSSTQILAVLSKRLNGQAAAAADTFSGKMKALKAEGVDFGAKVGTKLIPILISLAQWITNTVIPAISNAVRWVQDNWPKLRDAILPTIIAIQGYIEGFISTIETAWSIFGGRIVSFAQKYFGSLKTTIAGVLEVIKSIFRLFADVLTGKWGKLWGDIAGIFGGMWKIIRGAIGTAWTEITSIVSLAWAGIRNLTSSAATKVVSFVTGIPGKLLGLAGSFLASGAHLGGQILKGLVNGISGAASGVADIAKSLYNSFAGFVNSHLIDPIKHFKVSAGPIHVTPFSALPDIPKLAKGGVFDSATLAVIGEASTPGNREIASPETLMRKIVREESGGGASLARTRQAGVTIENMNVTAQDPHEAARIIGADLAWVGKTTGH